MTLVRNTLEDVGLEPLRLIIDGLQDEDIPPWKRIDTAFELMPYCYPKLKQVDETVTHEVGRTLQEMFAEYCNRQRDPVQTPLIEHDE